MNPDEIEKLYAITTIPSYNDDAWREMYNDTWRKIYNDSSPPSKPVEEYAIKGEMLLASHTYDDYMINDMGRDEIRRQLATLIALELLKSNHIEFTQMKDQLSGKTIVKARAFVTPNNQVQIIRTKSKIS